MDESSERQAVARGWGKWGQAGVPHKGWHCIDMDDLGPDRDHWQTCEMCETMEIRYAHVMRHPDYPTQLTCGCVCAGNMEQNLTAARRREALMKNDLKRRNAFPRLKEWRLSQKGNPWIQRDGWNVTIFPRGNGFKAVLSRGKDKIFLPKIFPSVEEAKLAAYDTMHSSEAGVA